MSRAGRTSPLEWLIAALGALLVSGAVAFLLHDAVTEPDSPPLLEVGVDTVIAGPQGFVVKFRIRNGGQETAASVQVAGELRSDSGVVEQAETTVEFVPAEAERGGGLLFTRDPSRYRLELRALGYDEP